MNKLNIFVCENFSPEFKNIIEKDRFDDVVIKPYPCMCENKKSKAEALTLLEESINENDEGIILCSKQCDILRLIPNKSSFKIKTSNYCFNHLANEQFINYLLQRGGYVIGLGWLNNWNEHIENAGFDKDTARLFYKDFCKELVFFDAGIDKNIEEKLKELSAFLELPYIIIPYEIETVEVLLKSVIFEWRVHKNSKEFSEAISQMNTQCAEYAAIFDLIGKIASYTNKRDTIDKIKEIFVMVFGAGKFTYWSSKIDENNFTDEIKNLILSTETEYIFLKEQNRFCIKIQQNKFVFGVIDVSEFLFPQYTQKYLNFATQIAKIGGLVLSNIEQYEKLIDSERELQYLSFHDGLTGLYNRTYINEILSINKDGRYLSVFIFDIDKLKYANDTYGHLEGDKLICGVANILNSCFRETDTVARIGGDEFIAILPDCDTEMSEMFKNRIIEAVIKNNSSNTENHLNISVSMGFAVSKNKEVTVEELMQKADELMYADKMDKRKL